MKLAGLFGIFVGLMMMAQWVVFMGAGQVPELHSQPIRIGYHLTREFLTAAGLVFASVGWLRRAKWGGPAYLFFSGMLVYSVIVSPGYFAQQGQWAMVLMFGVLLILAVSSIVTVARYDYV